MTDSFVVSQLGARMHYAVPRIFNQAGRLERLYTDICGAKGWPRILELVPNAALPRPLRRLSGRIPHGIPPEKLTCFEGIGINATVKRMMVPTRAQDTRVSLEAAKQFSRAVIASGFGSATGFYGIAGECLDQLREARRRGLRTVVEQIVAPRSILDRLVTEEADKHRGWEPPVGDDPLASMLIENEHAEWASADVIVCPSQFVRDGVAAAGGPSERCVVVPYGVDARGPSGGGRIRAPGPLRVLTVGALGLRKGTPYVAAAAETLGDRAEFRMVGPIAISDGRRREIEAFVQLTGPVPRSEIAAHYAWADVFLLPSVCEGSATVVYEALAAGVPVVTTENAGSVVRHGIDGFIVPLGDVEAICDYLNDLAGDDALLHAMSAQALQQAARHTVAFYGERLLAAIDRPETGMLPQAGVIAA
ncbi:glycosyltransferase family 4 protein [Mesorhizobium sp. CAU 1732]|uniref:glycosyltransferase family 4 protein n=1 Tax=Mesorhizobium sp. CAU 1732 TaxID=3140358 RepID=UPI00326130D8